MVTIVPAIRRRLRPVRRMAEAVRARAMELPHLLGNPTRGSTEWLVKSEVKYGGLVTNVARRRLSPLDRRSAEQLATWGMTGGDRMLHHGYASTYARYLAPLLGEKSLTLAEFGILKGTGLAIWCDLFPDARVIGLDIDLDHFADNRAALEKRGAFRHNEPEAYEYDQLASGSENLRQILGDATLDVVIDDGLHSTESIVRTWRAVEPFLSSRFVYLIEDYANLLDVCGSEFAAFDCRAFGMITVVSRGLSVSKT